MFGAKDAIEFKRCQGNSFLQIWNQFAKTLKQEELDEAAVITRMIWHRRNDVIHGKGFLHPNSIINRAELEVQTYKNNNKRHQPTAITMEALICSWKKSLGVFNVHEYSCIL